MEIGEFNRPLPQERMRRQTQIVIAAEVDELPTFGDNGRPLAGLQGPQRAQLPLLSAARQLAIDKI
tara:strand:+ start:56 stop:253 length:198 start_codon:yes stop_codon:yes gene_type:complete